MLFRSKTIDEAARREPDLLVSLAGPALGENRAGGWGVVARSAAHDIIHGVCFPRRAITADRAMEGPARALCLHQVVRCETSAMRVDDVSMEAPFVFTGVV